VPFVQLGNHFDYPTRHSLETPLSIAGDAVAAVKCDHIAIPVGAFSVGRRLGSLDRYDLVILSHWTATDTVDNANPQNEAI